MKKILFNIAYILLILFPIIANAEGIENFYIDAILEEDGDLRVREYYNMEGEFNGSIRDIKYRNTLTYSFNPNSESYGGSTLHNGQDIIINEIRAVKINSKFDFTNVTGDKFKKVNSAKSGDYGVYTVEKLANGYTYKIFLPSSKKKAFYIDYTIKDLAIVHNDIGELGWNIFNDSSHENIKNLKVVVHFPNNKNEFKVWAHGPLNGIITPENNNTLITTIANLRSYTAIDIRATFDKEIIPNSTKLTNISALEKILKYEEEKAAQANYEREQNDIKTQKRAQEKIKSCFEHQNRYCYDEAFSEVNKILDEAKKAELKMQLEDLDILITQVEERIATESVRSAEDFRSYYEYEHAYERTIILTNKELKQELLARLEIVKKDIEIYEKKLLSNITNITYIIIMFIIGIIIYTYLKHDKEFKTSFQAEYLREIPTDYYPTTVSYLFERKITNDAISAEILSLINKKIVLYEKIETKGKDDYKFILNKDYKKSNISAKEKKVIKLVFQNNKEITIKEMKKKASSAYRSFINNWDDLMDFSIKEAINENFYIDDSNAKYNKEKQNNHSILSVILTFFGIIFIISIDLILIGIILLICANKVKKGKNKTKVETKKTTSKKKIIWALSLILIGIIIIVSYLESSINIITTDIAPQGIAIFLSIIGIIYVSNITKRTQSGAEEYAKWKAFKKFLVDFGKMDIKELPEIKLWNEYLVYATVLGCADKLEKVMKLKIKDLGLDETDLFTINYHDFRTSISHGVTEAHNRAKSTELDRSLGSSSSSSSSWSSGGGGGGGFSSGGGSFGGGGGVGRF